MRFLKRCVNKVTLTVTTIAAVVGLYFLPGVQTGARYTGPGAENTIHTAPRGRTCVKPTVVPMNRNPQSGVAKGGYYVTNDSWNAERYGGLSQKLYVCGHDNWYAISTMNNDTLDGAVKTSPNVQETWDKTPLKLSRLKAVTSNFSDVPPGAGPDYGIWEFEYDIWLNGLANDKSTEVMIWTYNNGQSPGGSLIGSFTDAGQTYEVYRSPPPYQYIAFVDQVNNRRGSINLLDFFRYVISKGWMPSSSTLYQICHGVELVSTNSEPEKFAVSNFSINITTLSKLC